MRTCAVSSLHLLSLDYICTYVITYVFFSMHRFQQFVNSHDPEQMLKPSELLQLKEGLEEEVQSSNTTKDVEEVCCVWNGCCNRS